MVKNPSANAGDAGSIMGQEDPLGEEMANDSRYSCLEIPMDKGAWWATVHGAAKSDKRLSQHACHHSIACF